MTRLPRPPLVVAAITLAFGALLLFGDRYASSSLANAVTGASAATFCAVAAVAATRYVRDRDPNALFVATAAAVIGGVSVFGMMWAADVTAYEPEATAVDGTLGPVPDAVPVTTWMAAWAIAAALLVLAVPWRERRGRPPVRPLRVIAVTAGATGAAVAAIVVALGAKPAGAGGNADPGAAGVAAACIAASGLAVAGVRELRASAPTAPHPQLGIAWLIGVLVPVSQIQAVTFGVGLVRWIDAAAIVVPATALAGLLAAERTEATRMRRASDRAEQVLGGRAEIASMVAHEVRGPVATIKGLAATTSGSYDRLSDEERREFVGLIEDEASRLLSVVDQTSLALKIDAGTLAVERRPHDLAAVVREGTDAAQTGVHPVTAELAGGITATVDRRWIALAVRQVVDNAARFSAADQPIDVSLRRDGSSAVVEVGDRGPGVPPERRAEVFGRFARWRPPGYEDRQGSGLGLFICRGILAEHGGDVALGERPGGGTMLRLTIPLDAPPMEG